MPAFIGYSLSQISTPHRIIPECLYPANLINRLMRPSTQSPNPISMVKSSKKTTRVLSVLLSLLIVNFFTGCTYFQVKGVGQDQQKSQVSWLQEFNQAQKYIVLHQPGASLHLQNAQIDPDTYELRGIPVVLPPEHTYKRELEIGKGYRYKKREQSPLNEVHLFLNNEVTLTPGTPLSIPMASIEKIGYSDKDATRGVLSGVGIVAATLALVSIIVLLTKSSCPFIYADDGEGWAFQGEIYPGNTIENAQVTNYLKLPALVEKDGFYNLRITNELLEIQHTDQAVLEVVDHPRSVTVAMDPSGNIHAIHDPRPPIRALADGRHDLTREVQAADEFLAAFNTPMQRSDNTRTLDLWFEHDARQPSGKLVLSLKNSLWLDYVMGKFYEQFGDYYQEFQKNQQTNTREKSYKWREDQSLPLSVYVDEGNGWELRHQVYAVGPLKFQEIALPLSFAAVGDAPLKVRLQTGFMFWELDQVAIDYSPDMPLIKTQVLPASATDNYNQDARALLEKPDQRYLTQSEVGDWVEVRYQSPPRQGEARTVLLRNKGYYTYIRDFVGSPDFGELKKFRNPGHFTSFSEGQFNALIEAILKTQPEIVTSDAEN